MKYCHQHLRFLVLVSLFVLLSLNSLLFAAAPAAKQTTSSSLSDAQKLDEILKNQKEIISRLEELKKELAIVKIRATR